MPKEKKRRETEDRGRFEEAIEIILQHEGVGIDPENPTGYVNDPDDPGGETHFGITKRSYPSLAIGNLTRDEAIEIYKNDYWLKYNYDQIQNDTLAFMLFDQAVLCGPVTVNRMIQAVLRKDLGDLDIEVDGILGDKTIYALNSLEPHDLINKFKIRAERRYRDLDKPKYLKGWLNRLNSFGGGS